MNTCLIILLFVTFAEGCIPTTTYSQSLITTTPLTTTTPITTSTTTTSTTSTTTTTTTTTTTPPVCPAGWIQQAFSGVDYCYVGFTAQSITWNNAEASCVALGGHLASIHSAAENAFVYSLTAVTAPVGFVYTQQTWIGLQTTSITAGLATMAWSDGTPMDYPPGNPFTLGGGNLYPWYILEPDNNAGLEFCSFIATNTPDVTVITDWFDYRCFFLLQNYVCKKPLI